MRWCWRIGRGRERIGGAAGADESYELEEMPVGAPPHVCPGCEG
jgi:hypothetical protein